MIFFVGNDCTVINSVPSPVYQGSANTNNIYLIAPFAVNLQVTVAFKLPNGVWTERYPMTQVNELTGIINKQTGKPYVGWQFSLPNEITQYFGTVTAQFFFYAGQGKVITASSSTTFTVERGVPEILPAAPSVDVYDLILNNFSLLQQQLNNGTYAARAIYAWNSTYTYGAGELVFYPNRGMYGVFLKSLVSNNKFPPYVASGINSAYWEEIIDFDILNELYNLKTQAQAAANTSIAKAAEAGNFALAASKSAFSASNSEAAAQGAANAAADSAQAAGQSEAETKTAAQIIKDSMAGAAVYIEDKTLIFTSLAQNVSVEDSTLKITGGLT